jgi:hypothetical protein
VAAVPSGLNPTPPIIKKTTGYLHPGPNIQTLGPDRQRSDKIKFHHNNTKRENIFFLKMVAEDPYSHPERTQGGCSGSLLILNFLFFLAPLKALCSSFFRVSE